MIKPKNNRLKLFLGDVPTKRYQAYIKGLSGLIAYYPLNEGAGNALNQAPSTIGTLPGTVTGTTRSLAGKRGVAYGLSGTGDVLNLGTDASFNASEFTFIALVYFNSLMQSGGTRQELAKRDTPYIFDFGTDGKFEFALHNGSYQSLKTSKASWAAQTWFLVSVINKPGGNRKIYINGVVDGSTSGVTPTTSTNNFFIGGPDASGNGSIIGRLQHVAYFNRELTQAEQTQLAQFAGVA